MFCDMGISIGTCIVSTTLWSSYGVQSRSVRDVYMRWGLASPFDSTEFCHQQKEWNVKVFCAHLHILK